MSITIGIGKNLKVTPSSTPPSTDPDVLTYISGLTTALSQAQIDRLNTMVVAIKTGFVISHLSDYFDWMYVLAGETQESSLRNLAKRSHDATAVNSPVWTQWEGITGANNKYLNTNFDASTDAVVMQQNNASYGLYLRKTGVSSDYWGVTSNANSRHIFIIPVLAGNFYLRLNSTVNYTVANASSQGFFIGQRPDASNLEISLNGSALISAVNASTSRPSGNMYLFARNNSGASQDWSTNQGSFAFFGKRLTQAQITILVNAVEAYMDDLGKGILP